MCRKYLLAWVSLLIGLGCSPDSKKPDPAQLRQQVLETERAFSATMAQRDFAAFVLFLSDEAVFMSGAKALRGSQQVADAWMRYYDGATAPFSWQPETVEVLGSGNLALSTGPVFDPQGKQTGTYTSIWRQEAPGKWRIIFDKGCKNCE